MGRSTAGMNRSEAVYELLDRMKSKCPPEAHGTLAELTDRIDDMTTEIEALKMVAADPGIMNDWGSHFTKTETKLLDALLRAGGRGLTYDGMQAALYGDRPDDRWPHVDILKVLKTKIGAKFRKFDVPWRIDNRWGVGYVLQPSSMPAPPRGSRT